MRIRKFYDPAENKGGGFNIEGEMSLEDFNKPEPPKEPIGQPEPVNPEPVNPEPAKPDNNAEIPSTPEAPKESDWKEVLGKQDRKAVLEYLQIDEKQLEFAKEVEGDSFFKKAWTHRKEKGTLKDFIEIAGKDWDKESHVDLLRDDLKRKYPTLSKEKFEVLAKSRIDKRFLLGEDADPENAELASIELETEGELIRDARKKEQLEFIDQVKPVDRQAEAQKQQELEDQKRKSSHEAYQKAVDNLPETTKLLRESKIVVGEGESAMNFNIDPKNIIDILKNPHKLIELFESGERNDWDGFIQTIAFATNRKLYNGSLIQHGQSLGTKKIAEKELGNVIPPSNVTPSTVKESLGKAFMERGEEISLSSLS
jgi:hypothetical protein